MTQPQNSDPSWNLSRRTVLQLLGVGALGALGYSRWKKPQPNTYGADRIALPRKSATQKSVAVIGGGLAGLACAYELSQRGFQVTLLEKSPQFGGKIASWPIEVGAEAFIMEHGFHGFFPQYYNLKSLVSELQIQEQFRSLESYAVLFNGDHYAPEIFKPNRHAFPWNIIDLAMSSSNRWDWGINLASLRHLQVFRTITGFQLEKTYHRLDQISVADWVGDDFPHGLYDLYFKPFGRSTLNALDLLSTAELMQFFHFYFFGNPEGLAFDGTRNDMGTSLVNPLVSAIAKADGNPLTQVQVTEIQAENNQITGVTYREGGPGLSAPTWFTKSETQSSDDFELYQHEQDTVLVAANDTDALCLTCPHQGCTVSPQADGTYKCPCHGAQFNAAGEVTKGPAKENLTHYAIVDRHLGKVQLADTAQQETTLQADYYVIAADVTGVKKLFQSIAGDVSPTVKSQIEQLAIADPFAVGRFWFDQDFDWEYSDFTSLSGYELTDSITLYHRIQEQFREWSARTGGSVVELHAYGYKEAQFPDQEALMTTFEAELYQIVPSLQDATCLHCELVNQKNFSGYPPGSYEARPNSDSGVENLFFAGDWVKRPFPCGLMERAVSSGLLAANEILKREGLQRRGLLTVHPEGVFRI
ncbi:MAG: FAD-dependent oxidoreductase [Cyanobacteria bacterium P01_H01_bin.15]